MRVLGVLIPLFLAASLPVFQFTIPTAVELVARIGNNVCKVKTLQKRSDRADSPENPRSCSREYRACISSCTSTIPPPPICGPTQSQCGSACCDIPQGPAGGGQFCASPELSLCCSTFSWGLCGNECCDTPCCGTVCCPSGTACVSFGNCVPV